MAKKNYIIYADESDKKGRYYGNFYGGVLLSASDQEEISRLLNEKKVSLGINGEVKWQYVDQSRVDRYIDFVSYFFSFVESGRLKVRIMCTQNINVAQGLERWHHDNQYYILYYQFIKLAFGIQYCNPNNLDTVSFKILPDKIPDKTEKLETFKDYLSRIPNSAIMRGKNIRFPREDITDVDSKDHSILQGLDLVLGSINSRLNEKLFEKPEGHRIRGKRTRAREKLYKEINREIRKIYPNFNIGVSTACRGGAVDRWRQPYRHWIFVPRNSIVDRSLGKKG